MNDFLITISTMAFFYLFIVPCLKYLTKLIYKGNRFLKFLLKEQIESIKQTLKEIHDFIKIMSNHPVYNKIGIGFNALLLAVSGVYGGLLFAYLHLKGHSICYSLIPLVILLTVSLNLFYQSLKLYK